MTSGGKKDPWEHDRLAWEFLAKQTVEERLRRGYRRGPSVKHRASPTYKAWTSMAGYRRWCASHLPDWAGYGPAVITTEVK